MQSTISEIVDWVSSILEPQLICGHEKKDSVCVCVHVHFRIQNASIAVGAERHV